MSGAKHTPGPWEYVPSNANHGPYVANGWGAGDICDCYTMSKPSELAVCNGGTSEPIHFQHEEADANARLIAAAPDLLDAVLATRKLVAEAALTGFNHADGDWAERLFANQARLSAVIRKVEVTQ